MERNTVINVLDDETINRIAAGEVIERPSSVVKELVENAVDAGASAVTVEIRDGGIGMIRVTDNGCGIPKSEVRKAFLRHATSKIKSAADLLSIASLGFRGEALSSIAAVAQVELITKELSAFVGTRYCIDGGKEKCLEEVGAPDGTTFIVRNLFFNTPARRKFLKTPQTEGSYVAALMEKLSLSHPEISFRFILNGQTKLHTSGNNRLKDIIYSIFGRDTTAAVIGVDAEDRGVHVEGFIGKPVLAKGNRAFEIFFVNERYVKSGLLSVVVEKAYTTFLMQHQYPFSVLRITTDQSNLDVNVHPSKMEIKFSNQEDVAAVVYQAVLSAIKGTELIREQEEEEKPEKKVSMPVNPVRQMQEAGNSAGRSPVQEKPVHPAVVHENTSSRENVSEGIVEKLNNTFTDSTHFSVIKESTPDYQAKKTPAKNDKPSYAEPFETMRRQEQAQEALQEKSPKPEQLDLFEEKIIEKSHLPQFHIVGQVFGTYWIIEYENKMLMVDQHAAHEKVNFERFMSRFEKHENTSQQLMPPVIITLAAADEAAFNSHKEVFEEAGFDIQPFGGREYAIYAVPGNMLNLDTSEVLKEMFAGLSSELENVSGDLARMRIATMACKASIKGDTKVTYAEMKTLLEEMLQLKDPYNCPHGRPTMISFSRYELDKKFRRII